MLGGTIMVLGAEEVDEANSRGEAELEACPWAARRICSPRVGIGDMLSRSAAEAEEEALLTVAGAAAVAGAPSEIGAGAGGGAMRTLPGAAPLLPALPCGFQLPEPPRVRV